MFNWSFIVGTAGRYKSVAIMAKADNKVINTIIMLEPSCFEDLTFVVVPLFTVSFLKEIPVNRIAFPNLFD